MIVNPILPGFNPDPCICRKGDDYYMAVSTFEWFPGIPVYHSRDLKNWELYTHVITDDEKVDLKKLPSAKGIWAPCLTYCEEEDMEFTPEVHQHSAGLILYYDNMNYINLRKYYSETLGQSALSIIHLENGEKTEFLNTRIPVEDKPIYLRLYIEGRKSWFEWSYDGENYEKIGRIFDTTRFSDEYCKYGEFTGTMVGITCADRVLHKKCADFDFFEYIADESRMVE